MTGDICKLWKLLINFYIWCLLNSVHSKKVGKAESKTADTSFSPLWLAKFDPLFSVIDSGYMRELGYGGPLLSPVTPAFTLGPTGTSLTLSLKHLCQREILMFFNCH